jgi:hypothetical protein
MEYRLYILSPDDRIVAANELEHADDDSALAEARTLALRHAATVEVWSGARLLGRVAQGDCTPEARSCLEPQTPRRRASGPSCETRLTACQRFHT